MKERDLGRMMLADLRKSIAHRKKLICSGVPPGDALDEWKRELSLLERQLRMRRVVGYRRIRPGSDPGEPVQIEELRFCDCPHCAFNQNDEAHWFPVGTEQTEEAAHAVVARHNSVNLKYGIPVGNDLSMQTSDPKPTHYT